MNLLFISKSSTILPSGRGVIAHDIINGRAFSIHSEKKNWNDARQVCQSGGGDLAIVDQPAINDWISKENKGWGHLWIGATDQVGPNSRTQISNALTSV